MLEVNCDYCHGKATFVTGEKIYPHKPFLHKEKFWYCAKCNAYVGCHHRNKKLGFNGDEPKGRLANFVLRQKRMQAHKYFDPLWKSGQHERTAVYAWLSQESGIPIERMHIAMLDEKECDAIIKILLSGKKP